ncbi:Fork-head transcriptional regulator 2 [Grifola frondosa]|uniref:Fork-head transcriptional regulator 2 n=1 Tax=Grifola frondosa TaxID=5627 RepID=A0A1C7MKC8_GRIFR|nr:Fork-head transcriptional regulator 2 [Grifola frondosa]
MATIAAYPQDTSQLSSSVNPEADVALDKISAYYSLVFPNFTYYLQTLNVTIGRRCIPTSAASSSDNPQVDVDLGPLKSVSRLHAKIEYDEEEQRFVLLVIGRNGAWVDGVWSGSGSKVSLGDRSQIQIASRTFHFVLPPPSPPEDSPSPSSQSSGNRARSPSVDITSYSPPSSLPSCSPPPVAVPSAPPKPFPLPEAQLPNSNSIINFKSNAKRRRKPEAPPSPLPMPEVMPPKPQLTYAQLCYRAIKALGGKASLQEICQWIKDTYEWFKYCGKDWESSVRHNLSSNAGFKKLLRGKDEKGKGALWLIDEAHEHTFEELDARKQNTAVVSSGGKDGKSGKKGKAAVPLEPPLKRSVKGDSKGAPLPPPLTSTPLAMKTNPNSALNIASSSSSTFFHPSSSTVKLEPPASTHFSSASSQAHVSATVSSGYVPSSNSGTTGMAASSTTSASTLSSATPFPAIPASVRIPIIVGPVPSTQSGNTPSSPPQPIVLHENTLILNPEVFSHLTPQHLKDLEALGATKALEILQTYIVRYYKERFKAGGGRGRGRGKSRRGRGGANGRGSTPGSVSARADTHISGPFTTAPLPPRPPRPSPSQMATTSQDTYARSDVLNHAPVMASLQPVDDAPSPIVIVDDDPSDQEPATKRRRLDDLVADVAQV